MIGVREATKGDISLIHELGKNVQEFMTSDESVTFWPERILEDSVESDSVIILVAEKPDKSIVGFLIANLNRPLSKALIENIYVHPGSRGQGIGRQLLKAFIAKVRELSYEFVSTLTDNPSAVSTYKKAGFVEGETFLWLDLPNDKH